LSFGILFGLEVDDDIEEILENDYADFVEETKVLEIGDACPICATRLDLIDFSADSYVSFLSFVPVKARGSP
jgi:hypothetical protein